MDRASEPIPLRLLVSSAQGDGDSSARRLSRKFRVPPLDGGRSPFGENHLALPHLAREKIAKAARNELMLPVSDVPCPPQTAPQGARRPQPHKLRPASQPAADGATLGERGCRTAPASSQRSPLFAPGLCLPTPPLGISPPRKVVGCKISRQRPVHRGRSASRAPTECSEFASDCAPVTLSTKSGRSQSTACPCDSVGLLTISPQGMSCGESSVDSSCECESPKKAEAAVPKAPEASHFFADAVREELGTSSSCELEPVNKIMRWKKGEKIGAGSYGAVYKAQNKTNGHIFVVKEPHHVVHSTEYEDRLGRELDIIKDLEHPHIVKCLGHDYHEGHLYIHLEYVLGGSLRSVLSEFGPIDQALMPIAMRSLLEGLDYLHTQKPPIMHRDIKSDNVLVAQDFCLKLSDFGCSKCDDLTASFSNIGSVRWMAPEVIRGQSGEGHGRKADVWSMGCVFLEMATAERPWAGHVFDNVMQAMKHIEGSEETPQIPDSLTDPLRNLVACCLQRSPSQRPWASELLALNIIQSTVSRTATNTG